jgi:hypothetical protein
MTSNYDPDRLLKARLAEHVSARDEMIASISNQHLALTFGVAALAGVFLAGFSRWEESGDAVIFFAIAPISVWVLSMWHAEVVRMLRAVEFCRDQARLINREIRFPDPANPPIRWEAWRSGDPSGRTNTGTYIGVVAILSGAYLAAIVLGLIVLHLSLFWVVVIALIAGGILGFALRAVLLSLAFWGNDPSRVGLPPRVAKFAEWLRR